MRRRSFSLVNCADRVAWVWGEAGAKATSKHLQCCLWNASGLRDGSSIPVGVEAISSLLTRSLPLIEHVTRFLAVRRQYTNDFLTHADHALLIILCSKTL